MVAARGVRSDLLWLLIPPDPLTDPAAPAPLSGLRRGVDVLPQLFEAGLDQRLCGAFDGVAADVRAAALHRPLACAPQPPVTGADPRHNVRLDAVGTDVVVVAEAVDVALVALVELDNLQLRTGSPNAAFRTCGLRGLR